jgi:hypothetical protein
MLSSPMIFFYDSILTMNDRKLRPELDAGGAGNSIKSRWAELTEAYNDSVNKDAYGLYAFIEDEHEEFVSTVSTYDLCTFKQLDWEKVCGWFKEIVKDYTKAMQNFTLSEFISLTVWASLTRSHIHITT